MALAVSKKIPSLQAAHMFLHKNRKYVIENKRRCNTCAPPKPCPSRACKEKKRKPFWKTLFSRKPKDEKEEDTFTKNPPIECCKLKFYSEDKEDPDLSSYGGKAYKTCGKAYVIQKDMLPEKADVMTKEELEVKRIETHPDLKKFLEDPLPKFESVPLRMVEMSNRRLHPLYDKYRSTPRQPSPIGKECPQYRTISGPIDLHDVPVNIKFNKNLLERKNLYAEYKRVEPPRDVLGRLVEMKKNSMSLLEYSRREPQIEEKKPELKEKRVFDTLKQDKK